MRLYQKIILAILGIITLGVAGVTVYGIKMYHDANTTFNNIVEKVDRKTSKREKEVSIEDREPFSILLLGIDTGALGRTEQGRSDSMMVVTVNPEQKKSTIASLDRDIYTQIVGYDTMDKLNHAYAYGGVEMSMDSVENLLDIPIDHYVTINMQGMRDLIDAVGGIEVDNKIDFTLEGVHVPAGKITLNGKTGLAYARMRKDDPEGDIGRQKRQREVITKIVKKVMSLDSVSNYQKILKAVEKNSKTDLAWEDMLDIAENYIPAFDKIEQVQLQGEGQMLNGVYYQILGINELLKVQNALKTQLDMPTSETLPTGDQYTSGYAEGQFYDDSNGSYDASVQNQEDTGTYTEGTDYYDYDETGANYEESYTEGGY
ncbi:MULTISPECIES: LCP family glycopolymer transferase [Enterococcus]|uniref:LCP family glycopolymer transferase n=1 Tax=Enterococcus TaxID=1350 RepID=UPI00065E18B6|nr:MULTISPECIES: LCP family protein [Enterococcus]KAF1304803.1 LytR family transcriptional regulator [Enterococcus sp. JM9B]